jgi:hypothetical protein
LFINRSSKNYGSSPNGVGKIVMWNSGAEIMNNSQNKKIYSLVRKSMQLIEKFKPRYEYRDRVWKFYLKAGSKWYLFGARRDRELFILFSSKFENLIYNTEEDRIIEADRYVEYEIVLPPILKELQKIYAEIKKNPISAQRNVMKKISPTMREGLIHRSFVRKLIPDLHRFDLELGDKNVQSMIDLIQDFGKEDRIGEITAGKYFEYCKVAYLANSKHGISVKPKQSGMEMYAQWADNRDGGLKEIDQNSMQAFVDWYDGGSWNGGHPWEIYRGGNTSHIDLYVERYLNDWRICLSAYSSSRLAETCRIALAFRKAGLPFRLDYEKSYLKRLLCDDFIGIIPEYDPLHRGWQRFPNDFHVADVMHFTWFKDEQTKKWVYPARDIASLVYWLPEEPPELN